MIDFEAVLRGRFEQRSALSCCTSKVLTNFVYNTVHFLKFFKKFPVGQVSSLSLQYASIFIENRPKIAASSKFFESFESDHWQKTHDAEKIG